jgi:hypothetical protein
MREGITVEVGAADRARLEAIVAHRNSPQKHVWRARIVLLTAAGLGTSEIMRQAGTSKSRNADFKGTELGRKPGHRAHRCAKRQQALRFKGIGSWRFSQVVY